MNEILKIKKIIEIKKFINDHMVDFDLVDKKIQDVYEVHINDDLSLNFHCKGTDLVIRFCNCEELPFVINDVKFDKNNTYLSNSILLHRTEFKTNKGFPKHISLGYSNNLYPIPFTIDVPGGKIKTNRISKQDWSSILKAMFKLFWNFIKI